MRALFVEDNPQDLELLQRWLKKDGIEVSASRVDNLEHLAKALSEPWDIILSDYNLPGFSAVQVLRMIREMGVTTPVIVVSSEIKDEVAVELMRNGAADFVRKENPARLGAAISREVQAAKERVDRENQFYTLANSISQLTWMAEPDGRIFWYNRRWYEYTGTALEDLDNMPQVHRPEQHATVTAKWQDAVREGKPWEDIFELKAKTGEYRWFLSRALPLKDVTGQIRSWFGTNTDITEQLKIEEELKLAKRAAEEASLAKTRFLANMSHEIRTPLGVMMGFAELALEEGKWSKDVEHSLKTIQHNGKMLTRVIGEVLDLARIEASKIELEISRFDVANLISEVCAFLEFSANDKGIALKFDAVPKLPLLISTDPLRLRQILINLVGNAIKFTERGQVSIEAAVERTTPQATSGILKFTVRDSGIGIPLEHRSKLFEPFSQADGSMTRKYGGSGLGLALSRELAHLLGGDIQIAQSEVGVGTTFVCTVAIENIGEPNAHPKEEVVGHMVKADADLAGIHVLLVEDSVDNQALFSRYLRGAGATVEFAADGRTGVDLAFSSEHDLILMDIQMPILSGHEATVEIRSRGYLKPIIALTAHSLKEERDRAMQSGFSGFLTKPLGRKALIDSVLLHLKPS